MKNLKSHNLEVLTLQEIQQLKGGDETKVDVINENSVDDCVCTYHNLSQLITNKNPADVRCSCKCTI